VLGPFSNTLINYNIEAAALSQSFLRSNVVLVGVFIRAIPNLGAMMVD
jgi:hypothetical protein